MRALVAALCLLASTCAMAQTVVGFDSLDRGVHLKAYWYPANGDAKAPAVVLLHGCGGFYDRHGQVGTRMVDYAALLNAQGMHALVVDSLTPRGEHEICTQRVGTRAVTQANRRLDAQAALQWLAAQPMVEADRLGLMGWSNGGSTVLSTTNLTHREVRDFAVKPAFAIAFYPGCDADLKRGYQPSAPLLMLVGEADDWTPAAPCHELAQSAPDRIEIEGYPGAYHGFDTTAPVRVRKDVPNGAHPGEGVHVGGDADALRQSRERLLKFLSSPPRTPRTSSADRSSGARA